MSILFKISRDGDNFYVTPENEPRLFVGKLTRYDSEKEGIEREGLANDGSSTAKRAPYDPTAFRQNFGFWTDFIFPTAIAESASSFAVVNTYDRANFTYGFLQFAAHVPNGDFVVWFRDMLSRAEAQDYFPNLAVIHGRICSIELQGPIALEDDSSTAKLQSYLNEVPTHVDDREVIAAGKLMHWTINHPETQALQLHHGVELTKARMSTLDNRLGLNGRTADICCTVVDIIHQGRAGPKPFPILESCLKGPDPLANLLQIGYSKYKGRIQTLKKSFASTPQFTTLKWNRAQQDFV
jgi:hypothetical protein